MDGVELREIVTFPDNVFKFAKPETAIIFGQKLDRSKNAFQGFRFRRISKSDMATFKFQNRVPEGEELTRGEVLEHPRLQLLSPPLADVWKAVGKLPQFDLVAHLTIGFYFFPVADEQYPTGEIQYSPKRLPGFHQGFRLAEGTSDTHLLPRLEWLNQKESIIEWACGGTVRGIPRVIINHVRAGGGKWRHKAFIDDVDRPTTEAFLLLTPCGNHWLTEILWALANSPIANAFTLTNSATKQIGVRLLKRLKVPILSDPPTALVEAVRSYLTAARDFSNSTLSASDQPKRPLKRTQKAEIPTCEQLQLEVLPEEDSQENGVSGTAGYFQDHLRALHWRVDAEVMKLYNLPASVERDLLDYFDGAVRVGVPFFQDRYIPLEFRDSMRLDEFLRISDEWEQTDDCRCELIEKRFQGEGRSRDEDLEFDQLQLLYDQRRAYCRWLRTGRSQDTLSPEAQRESDGN